MNEANVDERNSLDLTEDENSSGGNSEDENHFHFMDCSSHLNVLLSTVPEVDSHIHRLKSAAISSLSECPKEATTLKNIPVKSSLSKLNTVVSKKVGQFTSVQIKPPTSSLLETNNPVPDTQDIPEGDILQDIETISIDSDDELESEPIKYVSTSQSRQQNLHIPKQTSGIKSPQNTSIYSQQQPPGKVVIIKKNNKYYKIIIPHNVMPNITQSIGSVLINIPEVCPLVISNDPQATMMKPSQLRPQQLSLNLDAVEHNKNITRVMEQTQDSRTKKPPINTRLQVLMDKRFCWTFNNHRKRDLEGFAFSDRLGFPKSQVLKAKKCEKTVISIIKKLEQRLSDKRRELAKFRKSLLKRDEVKFVKINTILKKGLGAEKFVPTLEPEETDDYGSDLLLTKKVVILNEKNNTVGKKHMLKGSSVNRVIGKKHRRIVRGVPRKVKRIRKYNTNFDIKPCTVLIVKDKRVEDAYVKYCQDLGLKIKKSPVISLKSKEKLFDLQYEMESNSDNINTIDSPTASAKQDSKEINIFERRKLTLFSKVIKTRQKLINEINNHKPFLILTDQTVGYNRSLEYYYDQFNKNNIIYVVNSNKVIKSSVLKAKDFVCAVEVGYVKLVDSELFCKFVTNGMKFSGTRNSACREDHNYALLQHYDFGP